MRPVPRTQPMSMCTKEVFGFHVVSAFHRVTSASKAALDSP